MSVATLVSLLQGNTTKKTVFLNTVQLYKIINSAIVCIVFYIKTIITIFNCNYRLPKPDSSKNIVKSQCTYS